MQTITFDVGTQPWDSVMGQVLEGTGVGQYPGWQDSSTGTFFNIVLGQMCLESVFENPTNRLLAFRQISQKPGSTAILKIRFSTPQNWVRFMLSYKTQYGPVTVAFYFQPSYGTGGRPGASDLIREISVQSGGAVQYSDVCRPITEIWITTAGLDSNLDTVEFDYLQPTKWQQFICFIRRFSHRLKR